MTDYLSLGRRTRCDFCADQNEITFQLGCEHRCRFCQMCVWNIALDALDNSLSLRNELYLCLRQRGLQFIPEEFWIIMAVGLTEDEYSMADSKLRMELNQVGKGVSEEEKMNEEEMAESEEELEEYEEADGEEMEIDGDDLEEEEEQMEEDEYEHDDDLSIIADGGTDFETSDEEYAGILTPSNDGDSEEDSWVDVRLVLRPKDFEAFI